MSDKLSAAGGRYNRISPSSGRGSIIAYSPLPKSEQDCLIQGPPGNNCLAIPLSAIQTDNNNLHAKPVPPAPLNLTGKVNNPHGIYGTHQAVAVAADGTQAAHKHAGQNNHNNNNGKVDRSSLGNSGVSL
ncbi:hypothetical protein pipiens_007016 [Culex pipiens pipiens]|uniref:Uncharacterized protein n=1 Tax=Culex pipiens pipiens TaxID=38569 RepID=A0ABD1DMI1_CULPP